MEKTEIRLGNIIRATPNGYSIKVTEDNISQIFSKIDIYDGDLITENILDKLNFKIFKKKWKGIIKDVYLISEADGIGFCYNKIDGDWECWLLNCDYKLSFMVKWVKYLHELQNTYFELSNGVTFDIKATITM